MFLNVLCSPLFPLKMTKISHPYHFFPFIQYVRLIFLGDWKKKSKNNYFQVEIFDFERFQTSDIPACINIEVIYLAIYILQIAPQYVWENRKKKRSHTGRDKIRDWYAPNIHIRYKNERERFLSIIFHCNEILQFIPHVIPTLFKTSCNVNWYKATFKLIRCFIHESAGFKKDAYKCTSIL